MTVQAGIEVDVDIAAMVGNLAATVRNQHNPDCACHQDQAITEPINPEDAE